MSGKIEIRRYPGESFVDVESRILDTFYTQRGPCCAGCDWWGVANARVGECTRSAPVSGVQRWAMVGIESISFSTDAGHIMTPREHHCGDFKDGFDWSTLPLVYLKRIGRKADGSAA